MKVCFRTISNKVYYLELNPTDTISEIKHKLFEKYQFEPDKTKLIYKSKMLDDKTTLESNRFDKSGFIVLNTFTKKKTSAEPTQNKVTKTESPSNQKEENSIKTENKSECKKNENALPSAEPLPLFTNPKYVEPQNFKDIVNKLVSMGFYEGDCEMAVRASFGDIDRAAEFLISGYIPDVPSLILSSNIPVADSNEETDDSPMTFFLDDNNEEEEEDNYNLNLNQVRNELIRNPQNLETLLNIIANDNPSCAYIIRNDPKSFLLTLGLNPNDFDLSKLEKRSQYEELISKFTKEEIESIHSLEKLGFDTMIIIQVFEACDKNLEKTRLCLDSMK